MPVLIGLLTSMLTMYHKAGFRTRLVEWKLIVRRIVRIRAKTPFFYARKKEWQAKSSSTCVELEGRGQPPEVAGDVHRADELRPPVLVQRRVQDHRPRPLLSAELPSVQSPVTLSILLNKGRVCLCAV